MAALNADNKPTTRARQIKYLLAVYAKLYITQIKSFHPLDVDLRLTHPKIMAHPTLIEHKYNFLYGVQKSAFQLHYKLAIDVQTAQLIHQYAVHKLTYVVD